MKKNNLSTMIAAQTRQLRPEGAYFMLSLAQKLEREGKPIIHLEIGQPDSPTPKHIIKAAKKALDMGKTKYTAPLGLHELRKEIAVYITRQRGVVTTVDEIAVTPSGKTAIFAAMAAVLNPGDDVLYPDPGFPTYRALIDYFGCKPKPYVSMNTKDIARNINSKTKLIILNSPSNPTGGVIPMRDLKKIASMVKKTNALVLSDEMYSELRYEFGPYASIYNILGMKNRTLLVHGFSKTFAMTGWRLGFMVMPQDISPHIENILTHTIGCTASFTQEAGIAALRGSNKELKRMLKSLKKRRDHVTNALNDIPGIHCDSPSGAFYAFPNISSFGKTSQEIALYLLNEAGVAVLPGTAFGSYGEGYLRISYATSKENLEKGIQKIRKALAMLKSVK